MIPISTESLFSGLRPALFLLEPVSAQELTDTGIFRFLLWGFKRDELVEVLIDGSRFAGAAVCREWGAVSASG
jgi:hypothetical protein